MSAQILSILVLAVVALAHPRVNCASYTCSIGWTVKASPRPSNIACLGDVCTDRTCCNPPTCLTFACALGTTIKGNAGSIQCPGNDVSQCTQSLCCNGVPPPPPTCPNGYQFFYSKFLGDVRVKKLAIQINEEGVFPIGAGVDVSKTNGGDGIMVNPENHKQLFVGGQQERLFIVDTTNTDILTNWWRQRLPAGSHRAFHVRPLGQGRVVTTEVHATEWISVHTLVGGTLPDQVLVNPIHVAGGQLIADVIMVPGGYWFGSSTESGSLGNVGTIAFSADFSSATATPRLNNVRAHAGIYEPFSNTVLLWGANTVTQYDLAFNEISRFDTTALVGSQGSALFRHVDNGVVDGKGRVLIAANNGMLVWFDLRATGRVASAVSGSFAVEDGDGFDDLTIPVCV